MNQLKQLPLIIISLASIVALFYSAPNSTLVVEVIKALSPLGHIVVFFLWSGLLLKLFKDRLYCSTMTCWAGVLGFTFILGLGIEILQPFTGRSAEIEDVLFNFLGSFSALIFLGPKLALSSNLINGSKALAVCLLAYLAYQPTIKLIDIYNGYHQFPVISDLTTAHELLRWNAHGPRTKTIKENLTAVEIDLPPFQYSGFRVYSYRADWSNYDTVNLSMLNESSTITSATVIIHRDASEGQLEPEHIGFHQEFDLRAGWNHISLNLLKFRNHNQDDSGQAIDLSHVNSLTVFTINPKEQFKWIVDRVWLTNSKIKPSNQL